MSEVYSSLNTELGMCSTKTEVGGTTNLGFSKEKNIQLPISLSLIDLLGI